MKEDLYTPDCIRTFTGRYVNVFEPTVEMICIEDIAHALARQCRFGGHLKEFYSVAQHSLDCANRVPDGFRLQALLHDASEAYLLDMPSPIKCRLGDYRGVERKLMFVIAEKFGFAWPMGRTGKGADRDCLEWEWEYLMLGKPFEDPEGFEAANFFCWEAGFAERRFLDEYYKMIYG